MGLQDRLNRIREATAKQVPQEFLDVVHQFVNDLRDSGIMETVLKVGDKAPSFTLLSYTGNSVELGQLLANGPLVISFYRGRW